MEIKSRFVGVSAGQKPHYQNVYFVGDKVNVTCKALHKPNGKFEWTMRPTGTPALDFADLHNFITNTVETVSHGNSCVPQTVSTFSTTAVKEMTLGYLSCYAVRDKANDYYPCSGSGDPLEYCVRSHEFNVVDAPHKGPELRVVSNQPTPTVIEGDILVVLCQIYAVKGGSLIWAIFSPNGTSRTLEHNV
ncbi:hypothetical protein EGW08_007650, partial [Elysia chlorotica]